MMRTEFTMDQMNQVNGGAKMYDPGFFISDALYI